MKRIGWALAAGVVAWTCAAAAQTPPQIAAKVRAAGPRISMATLQDYAAMFPKEPYPDVSVARDLHYGPDALQRLDVFDPAPRPARPAPVLLFVHGGGFVRGDKHTPGSPFQDNVMLWATRNGMVGVDIDYRLAPKDPWPAGVDDLASAIAWTRANIARYGGDPERIFIWGHSAGANHVADWVAHPDHQGPAASSVKGAILLSPFYPMTVTAGQASPYYGTDANLQSGPAQIQRLVASRIPVFLAGAQFDPEGFQAFRNAAHAALDKAGKTIGYVYLKDHGHIDEGLAVGTSDVALTAPLLAWIRAQK
jgi:triacylglycerol lipase